MSIEDVVVVSTVQKHIRGHMLQVDTAETPLLVEAKQLINIAPGHRTPPPSSWESVDNTRMAGAWYPRSFREKAEAEARVKVQEAMRLRPDAEAKKGAEAEEKARKDAEKACLEGEEKTRKDAEEKARLEAVEAHKDAKERAEADAEAKAAESEATCQAEAEAEKMKREAEAKTAEEKLEDDWDEIR